MSFPAQGQALMQAIDQFPVPVIAAIRGYCMGGGMDLALACDYRIAAPNAVFGHRGASLGVMARLGGSTTPAASHRKGAGHADVFCSRKW